MPWLEVTLRLEWGLRGTREHDARAPGPRLGEGGAGVHAADAGPAQGRAADRTGVGRQTRPCEEGWGLFSWSAL